MKSCLYKCLIYHDRRRPKQHSFKYRLFFFGIDLDEIDQLLKIPFISKNSGNIYTWRDSDHLQRGKDTVKNNLVEYLRENDLNEDVDRIFLVTHLRTFGYQFNPVSFYFVFDSSDQPICAVAEVANTYNEQKLYLLHRETLDGSSFSCTLPKEFYISPFSDLDCQLHFDLKVPDNKLRLSINESDNEGIYFRSGMVGETMPLNALNLALQTLRYPFITLQVITAIHWHALLLFLKKIRVRRKSDKPDLQTNTTTYLPKRIHFKKQKTAL